jgi:hypothetical protein
MYISCTNGANAATSIIGPLNAPIITQLAANGNSAGQCYNGLAIAANTATGQVRRTQI